MASTKISKTPSGAGNRNKWTISLWLKRSKLGVEQIIASCYGDSNNQTQIKFESDDQLYFNDENSGNTNGRIVSTAKYRDTNAWYHMVFIWDKDNSTSGDKIRMYVNGERITSFSDTGNAPSALSEWNSTTAQQFGAKVTSDYFEGVMSHIHFCDGYAYDPSYFGETDSTTGEWKIKTSPSVSYGTNGYFWLKDNVATTDNSPNSNTFTASGTLTKTEDCPSNVFSTLQGLFEANNNLTLSNGNTKAVEGSDNWRSAYSNLGASSGKFYCEAKITYQNNTEAYVGVAHEDHINGMASFGGSWGGVQNDGGYDYVGYSDKSIGMYSNGNLDYPSTVNVGGTWQSNGDIMSIAMDLDNSKVYFAKNGVWANGSGGWGSSTFDSSTGGQTIVSGLTFFGFSPNQSTFEVNFGNGYFGTTAVSSAGTNASNLGIFEYDVPSGYTALCTKGLNL